MIPIVNKYLYIILLVGSLLLFSSGLLAQVTIGGYNAYYGHLHNHTSSSDGKGTVDQAYSTAKTNGLHFFGLAEHSHMLSSTEWSATQMAADTYNQPGVFTTFRGFEWTTSAYGHVAVINTPNLISAEDAAYNTFPELITWLNSQDQNCFAFFNHPGDYNGSGTEFDHFPSNLATDKIVGMEFWNKSVSFTRYYASLAGVMVNGFFSGDGMPYYDEALQRNWKIAPEGSEDNHTADWGANGNEYKTGVLAAANTREDLLAAFKARRFFSTLDKNTAISFKLNGNEMGSTITAGNYSLQILAADGDSETFSKVELLKKGVVVSTWTPGVTNVSITGSLTGADADYFYIRVYQSGNLTAVSAPIWISGTSNQSPFTSITSPLSGATFAFPSAINIEADASDPDGTIALVEFFSGTTFLGSDNTAPFSFTWSNSARGTYLLSTKVTDNSGATATSTQVTVQVTDSPATFDQIGPLCQFSAPPDLPVFSNNTTPVKGWWDPPLINSFTSGSTMYTFTPYPGQNAQGSTMTITINPALVPLFVQTGPYPAETAITSLPELSTNNIAGLWNPGINNRSTSTYTFTPNNGQCSTKSWMTITIKY